MNKFHKKTTKKRSGKQQELDKIFSETYGMTTAGALRERKRRDKIRKDHEKKRGH